MLFHEFYSAYYNAMANILSIAVERPVGKDEMIELVRRYAFGESTIVIEEAIADNRWQFMYPDGTTSLLDKPKMPLTLLEKQWLKAILMDPRIRLFISNADDYLMCLQNVTPLFTEQDYILFDQYSDGDPYTDEVYIHNFRIILDALQNRYPLKFKIYNRFGEPVVVYVLPEYLEYSIKDDKFRLIASDGRFGRTINLGRVICCEKYEGKHMQFDKCCASEKQTISLFLTDDRNTLERALMHFAHFEKNVKEVSEKEYVLEIEYSKCDETELVIRILSFGPTIRVISPDSFRENIKNKLKAQMTHHIA